MSNFFKKFPDVLYEFGNNTNQKIAANNLTTYIDLFDQLKGQIEFYEIYNIQEEDRPDTLSQRLYGTTDYHWTFFLMNDNLRNSGWPLSQNEVYNNVKEKYPNRVIITETPLARTDEYTGEIISLFPIGSRVKGNISAVTGTVVGRNVSMGQLIIKSDNIDPTTNEQLEFNEGEQILYIDDNEGSEYCLIKQEMVQYLAPRYYIDIKSQIVDLEPVWIENNPNDNSDESGVYAFQTPPSTIIPVTNMDYYINENLKLKEIAVIRKNIISSIVDKYDRYLIS